MKKRIAANFEDYAEGKINVNEIKCALCGKTPCNCPEFGTDEYLEMIDKKYK